MEGGCYNCKRKIDRNRDKGEEEDKTRGISTITKKVNPFL
jgi:hypothetical protein